jgi:hypothetical protein|tara:strand:+ start:308 stop:580 length:273 start_codon:yes stop_codon:yes gene_type:complete
MASKQKLSAKARKAKAIRDKKCAMTPDRKRKKAHSQRVRRAAIKKGKKIKGLDWDHKDGRFETIARNRANDGKGTKREGKKKYKVPTRKA